MAQIGYNNNVRYRDRDFHIQTEDGGARTSSIVTHLFVDGGRILHTVKASYADRLGENGLVDIVKALMKTQHKAMFAALREGRFDAELGESAAIPARPSQMPPASIEPIEAPRARDTLVVHPPSPSSDEPPPDTARAPMLAFDTLRPVPPPVSLSVPAAPPPPAMHRLAPVPTTYRSVNPQVSRRAERTERAAIFQSQKSPKTPAAAEATAALDEVLLAFLST